MQEKLRNFRPQQKNANKHNQRGLRMLDNAMSEDGYVAPMTAAADGEIIDGSARLERVAERFPDVDPIVIEHDGTRPIIAKRIDIPNANTPQAKRISLRANRIAEVDLDWDIDILKNLETEINLSNLFTEKELVDLGLDEEEVIEDDVPEVPIKEKTITGDLYELGRHRLLCGDSIKTEDVERLMDGKKADMVFTSPPYNANTQVGGGDIFTSKKQNLYRSNNDNLKLDEYIEFVKSVLEMCFKFTNGFIFWNVSYNANSRYEYIKQITDRLDFLIEQICWKKTSAIPCRGSMRRAWEPIYVFSTSKKSLSLNDVYSNVWEISNKGSQQKTHKACFPVILPMEAIKILPKTKIILDPLLGSGSTLIAAEKTNRICYGMEIDPHYCDVIVSRYCKFIGNNKVKLNGKESIWEVN